MAALRGGSRKAACGSRQPRRAKARDAIRETALARYAFLTAGRRAAMLPHMRSRFSENLLFVVLLLVASPLNARVVRVQIDSRTDVLNGRQFGDAGAYERIQGRVYFSLAVANPHNQPIVDLRNAINLKDGDVEFSSSFVAVRPKDASKGNGSLLLEVPNRGYA